MMNKVFDDDMGLLYFSQLLEGMNGTDQMTIYFKISTVAL